MIWIPLGILVVWLGFRFIAWMLLSNVDAEILQNQQQKFTLRLWDGGYSKTHEKYSKVDPEE